MSDITRAIALAVTDRQSAVNVLRGRLAHDWTDVIPPELRDMYERDWAEAFVERLAEVLKDPCCTDTELCPDHHDDPDQDHDYGVI